MERFVIVIETLVPFDSCAKSTPAALAIVLLQSIRWSDRRWSEAPGVVRPVEPRRVPQSATSVSKANLCWRQFLQERRISASAAKRKNRGRIPLRPVRGVLGSEFVQLNIFRSIRRKRYGWRRARGASAISIRAEKEKARTTKAHRSFWWTRIALRHEACVAVVAPVARTARLSSKSRPFFTRAWMRACGWVFSDEQGAFAGAACVRVGGAFYNPHSLNG